MAGNRESPRRGDPGLSGFAAIQPLYESAETFVYRATRIEDRLPVVLKGRTVAGAIPVGTGRCRYEHYVLTALDAPGIIRTYGLQPIGSALYLLLEDCGGQFLDGLMEKWGRAGSEAFPLEVFFLLADKAVQGVAGIHAAGIVHKDLCPSNLVYNETSGELWIIDFDAATTLGHERPDSPDPHFVEGTLAYMSPEQTGRMNRTVDYRSDCYSLGATFYELLTGSPPFRAEDTIEMVHHHMARTCRAPPQQPPGSRGAVGAGAEAALQGARGSLPEFAWSWERFADRVRAVAHPNGKSYPLGQPAWAGWTGAGSRCEGGEVE